MSRKQLLDFCKDRVYFRVRQAFYRWRFQNQRDDYMARMKALCIRGTTLQYKASLFYGWRMAVTYMKKRKFHIKVKALNCLKKNVTHR